MNDRSISKHGKLICVPLFLSQEQLMKVVLIYKELQNIEDYPYTSNPYLLYTTDDEIQSISQEEEIHIRLPKNFQCRRRINKTWSNRTLGKNIKNRIHFSIDYHLR